MALPIRLRTRATASVALATALVALSAVFAPAAHADTEQPPAWSVDTVDNERGSSRPNFSYDVNPGDVITDTFSVANTGQGPLTLTIYAADAFTTATGAVDILENGEPSVDAGLWVAPSAGSVTLEPGASIEVPFTLTVPGDATPGDHSAAIVASLLPGDSTDQVKVERRLGLRIDMRVSGELAPTAEIRSLSTNWNAAGINPFGGGTMTVSYELVNTGNVRLASLEDLRLSGIGGSSGVVLTGSEVPELLPGSAVTITRDVTSGAIGPLSGELTVYLQPVGAFTDVPVAVSTSLSAFALPWSLVVLFALVVLIVAAIIFIVWRRRRVDLLLAGYDAEQRGGAQLDPPRGGAAGGAALAVAALGLVVSLSLANPSHAAADEAQHAVTGVEIPAATPIAGNVVVDIPTSTANPSTVPTGTTPAGTTTSSPAATSGAGTGSKSGNSGTNNAGGLVSTGSEVLAVAIGVGALALVAGVVLMLRRRRAR